MRIRRRSIHGGKDSGYMLLFLMLAVAVLTITMLGVARNYKRAVQRDREVEMIHRGEQYERAVRRFYIKNSRYPVSIEQLENMNKIRYLRKRYKDPMSPDGEWKLVHATDVKLTATGVQPATNATGTQPADGSQPGSPTGSTPGQDAGNSSTGGNAGTGNTTGGGAATGTNSGSAFGNSGSSGTGSTGSAFGNSGSSGTGNSGSAFGNSGNSGGTGSGIGNSTQGSSAFGNSSGAGNAANGQVLGGGDVYGVVSKSKKEGFHIFGEKGKYNEWFFIYDPSMDKGQLLVGPYNPKMFVGTMNSGQNSGTGAPGTGAPGSGIGGNSGTSNTFGGSPTSSPTPQQPSQPTPPNQ